MAEGNRAISPEEFAKVEAATSEPRQKLVSAMLESVPLAKRLQLAMGKALQGEKLNLPGVMLALAMFGYSMNITMKANFGLSDDEYAAIMDVAAEVAEELATRSNGITLIDPRDGSSEQFKTVEEATQKLRKIHKEESEVKS